MDLFKLLGTISISNDEANKALEDTTSKAKTTGVEIEKIRTSAVNVGTALTGFAGVVGGAFYASVENTREYREQMNMLTTAFSSSGHSAESAQQTYSSLNSVLGDSGRAVEAAGHIAKLASSTKEMQTWTDICTGVWATFGESLPIEGLTEAANETAKVGQVTGVLADALNWMGVSEEEFNARLAGMSSEQERQQLIMETLNDTYKTASEQYKQNNADIIAAYEAQDKMTAAVANFGAVGEPILTTMQSKLADIVNVAFKWIAENGEAVGAALTVIATGIAMGAIAAHPYAAAIAAVAAGLAYLNSEEGKRRQKYDHFFDGYSDEDISKLQEWVTAMQAVKAAEAELEANPFDNDAADRMEAAQGQADALYAEVKAIDGLIAAYNAWRSGQAENQGKDLYLDVPVRVSEGSESEVQSELMMFDLASETSVYAADDSERLIQTALDAFDLEVDVKLKPDYSDMPDGSHATGLNRVPYDGYRAILHKDEAVLTATEAAVWRRGGSNEWSESASSTRKNKATSEQPITVNLTVNGVSSSPYEIAGEVRNALELLRWQS